MMAHHRNPKTGYRCTTKPKPIPELVNKCLAYDPDTGIIRWHLKSGDLGGIAGSKRSDGYRKIDIGSEGYLAHRVAWFLHYGEQPPPIIDHVNGKSDDNRIANLRAATPSQNVRNHIRKGARTRGVFKRGNRFRAVFNIHRNQVFLGSFETEREAALAVDMAAVWAQQYEFHPANIPDPDAELMALMKPHAHSIAARVEAVTSPD